MTTYAKDFSDELTTGVFASDFTSRYASTTDWTIESTPADAEDDRSFQSDGTGTGVQLVSWDDVDGDANRDNCEIVGRFQQTVDNDNEFQIWARASGSSAAEDGYVMSCRSTGDIQFYRYDSGTFVDLGGDFNSDFLSAPWTIWTSDNDPTFNFVPPNLWLWYRFRVNGTGATVTLQGKFWIDGLAGVNEPSEWMMKFDDTNANRKTAAGWIGIGKAAHSGSTYVDYFAVGTNGDAAPINASTNTTMRISSVWAEVIGEEVNPNVRLSTEWLIVAGQDSAPTARVSGVGVKVLHDRDESAATDVSGQLIITTGA